MEPSRDELWLALTRVIDPELRRPAGILDADVYGHSIPHMLGVHQKPVLVDQMIVPPVKDDLKLMSIGFFLDDNSPVMWRGPMLHRALEQFLSDVHWGAFDLRSMRVSRPLYPTRGGPHAKTAPARLHPAAPGRGSLCAVRVRTGRF